MTATVTPTRARLVEAAADLLDDGGPAAVTLREVGARAGVSRTAPYRHFADKNDLLAAIAAGALRDLAARLDACPGGPGPALLAAASAYLDWARAHPVRFTLAFGPWEDGHAELSSAADAAVTAFHRRVAAAVDAGVLRGDPDELAGTVWAHAHGAVCLDLAGHLRKHPAAPTAEELVAGLVTRLGR